MPTRAFRLTPDGKLKLSEADVVRQIKDFLALRNWVVIRCHVGTFVPLRVAKEAIGLVKAGRAEAAERSLNRNIVQACDEGTSDFLAVHPSLPPLWIETKRPGGKLRPAQSQWLNYMAHKRGFYCGYWDSLDAFLSFYREKIERR